MPRTTASRIIDAPLRAVFQTVSEIERYAAALPHIVGFEYLTAQRAGAGTKFRETRLIDGREQSTELLITELVPDRHVRLVSDQGGALWDTVFTVREVGGQTELVITMDSSPYKLLARLYVPFISGVLRLALERDLELVKAHCEGTTQKTAGRLGPPA